MVCGLNNKMCEQKSKGKDDWKCEDKSWWM